MKKYLCVVILLFFCSCVPLVVRDCVECVSEEKIGKSIQSQDTIQDPETLSIKIYKTQENFSFPEEAYDRYNTSLGIAISGGGFRSYSCAIGQIKALLDMKVIDTAGMLSVLSGSSWFAAPFMFAHDSISDEMLFRGSYGTPPNELTVEALSQIEAHSLGYPMTELSNEEIIKSVCESRGEGFPKDRLFNAILRRLLRHFNLADKHSFFTLDSDSRHSIVRRNPALENREWYMVRPNRPFLAVSSTLYDSAFQKHHKMHHIETTPLYFGTKEQVDHIKSDGDTVWLGGGYIEQIGVNSRKPTCIDDTSATVSFPDFQYTLFDMIGTSGSAPGSIFDHLHIFDMMSEYNYWPLEENADYVSEKLSFVDGGDLENMSLVPLLRRGYRKIIAFDNVDTPVGSKKASHEGISYDIARLFGYKPKHSIVNTQSVQVFPQGEFEALSKGLQDSTHKGVPYYRGKHTIIADNPFGIKPGSVEILWISNGLNKQWKEALPHDVKALFKKCSKHLRNFPHYKTVFQNGGEMFQLHPEQINLLANMWYYSLVDSSQSLTVELRDFVQ